MLYRIRYRLYQSDIVLDIVYDIVCSMESDSVLAVGCLNNDRSVLAKSYAWRPLALLPILKDEEGRSDAVQKVGFSGAIALCLPSAGQWKTTLDGCL
jgi:hypothetical protein